MSRSENPQAAIAGIAAFRQGCAGLAAAAALAFSPATAVGAAVEDPSAKVYAALGDSYTGGGDEEGRGGYVGRIFEYWRDAGLVDTLSQHSGPGLDLRGALQDTLRDINQPSDTAIVTVNGGLPSVGSPECDFGRSTSSCPAEALLDDIVLEIEGALATDPGDETRILMTYGPLPASPPPYPRFLGPDATIACVGPRDEWGLNDLISGIAARNSWLLADTFPFVEPNRANYFSSDGIHPNAAGYTAMTEAFKAPATPATEPCPDPDVLAPALELSGRTKQRLGKTLRVKAECSEECTATATGKLIVPGVERRLARGTSRLPLEPITQQLGAHEIAVFEIRIERDARRAAARALDAGEAVQARLKVTVVDPAANATVAKHRIDLRSR